MTLTIGFIFNISIHPRVCRASPVKSAESNAGSNRPLVHYTGRDTTKMGSFRGLGAISKLPLQPGRPGEFERSRRERCKARGLVGFPSPPSRPLHHPSSTRKPAQHPRSAGANETLGCATHPSRQTKKSCGRNPWKRVGRPGRCMSSNQALGVSEPPAREMPEIGRAHV